MTEEEKREHSGWWGLAAAVGGAVLGASVGSAIGYATYEPCVPDPNEFLSCLIDGPEYSAIRGAIIGFPSGVVAALVLWVLWRRLSDRPRSFASSL